MNDNWGDDDGIEAEPFDVNDEPTAEREEREPGRVFGLDVAAVVEDMARPAIARTLQWPSATS